MASHAAEEEEEEWSDDNDDDDEAEDSEAEVYEDDSESDFEDDEDYADGYHTIPEIQHKISNASCHKCRQGYVRKLQQAYNRFDESKDTKGLVKCNVKHTIVQNDTGASHCLTNNKHILKHFRKIKPIAFEGIDGQNVALYATGIGYLPIAFDDGEVLLVKCLYSEHAATTLISPTAIAQQHKDNDYIMK